MSIEAREIMQDTADQIPKLEKDVATAEELIKLQQAAGEDTITIEGKLKEAKRKLLKWKSALAKNNITPNVKG